MFKCIYLNVDNFFSFSLSKAEIDREIKQAFQLWEDVSSLTFERRTSGSVHIDIRLNIQSSPQGLEIGEKLL